MATSYADALSTGDRTTPIAVTDSGGIWAVYTDPEKLVNGSTAGTDGVIFNFTASVVGLWVKFDLGTQKVMDAFKNFANGTAPSCGTWQWEGSNDNTNWTALGSAFLLSMSNGAWTEITEPSGNTTAYQYYRMIGTSGNGNATNVWSEFDFKLGDASVGGGKASQMMMMGIG